MLPLVRPLLERVLQHVDEVRRRPLLLLAVAGVALLPLLAAVLLGVFLVALPLRVLLVLLVRLAAAAVGALLLLLFGWEVGESALALAKLDVPAGRERGGER